MHLEIITDRKVFEGEVTSARPEPMGLLEALNDHAPPISAPESR
jgi:hypothetical protein